MIGQWNATSLTWRQSLNEVRGTENPLLRLPLVYRVRMVLRQLPGLASSSWFDVRH
jgi:hypothetical protein